MYGVAELKQKKPKGSIFGFRALEKQQKIDIILSSVLKPLSTIFS
jgi:hypothetical protein